MTLSVLAQANFFSPLLGRYGTEQQKMEFLAPVEGPKNLHERFRLNPIVYQAMFERA